MSVHACYYPQALYRAARGESYVYPYSIFRLVTMIAIGQHMSTLFIIISKTAGQGWYEKSEYSG